MSIKKHLNHQNYAGVLATGCPQSTGKNNTKLHENCRPPSAQTSRRKVALKRYIVQDGLTTPYEILQDGFTTLYVREDSPLESNLSG